MSPDLTDTIREVGIEDPFRAVLVLLFISLLVERSLSVIYGTRFWQGFRQRSHSVGVVGLRLYIAIIVNVMLAFTIRLDAFQLLTGCAPTALGMLITGLFNAGGSKAWSDLYRQFNEIREGKVKKANGGVINEP